MNRLKELYESIEKLKNLGCNLSDSIDEINRLEEELIINEIIPTLKDAISPIINQIQRELLLVVEYTPNTPLVVKPTKKRSFAIPQELDSGVEKKYSISPHTKNKKTNLKVIFPDGKSIGLDNMQGVDLSGKAGITGEIDNHFGTLLKGVVLSSIMGSAGAIVTDRKNDWRGAAAEGAGEQIVTIGDRFADRALSRQPTINIEAGTRLNIMVHSDLILEPYGE